MNAGNERVEEEDKDHHTEDRHALHQEHLVSYSVLWRRNKSLSRVRDRMRQSHELLNTR